MMASSNNTTALATRLRLHGTTLTIPQVHLGVYLMSGVEAKNATRSALAAGYRAIDSAQMYRNERHCGEAIRDFLADKSTNTQGLKREDIFFTSKLERNSDFQTARQAIRNSVRTCGLGYIDLFLLHSPYGGKKARLESWKAIEAAIDDGEIKIGGVSNFGVRHLEELLGNDSLKHHPAVNQIEVHPFNTRAELATFCQKSGIVVEAYAPLARARRMNHPVIVELTEKYNCTPAQLMVRWSVQHGYVPLPKSVSKERIVSNGQIDHFEITKEDLERMDELDEYLCTSWDPTNTR